MPMVNELMGWNFNFGLMKYGKRLYKLCSLALYLKRSNKARDGAVIVVLCTITSILLLRFAFDLTL
ncbi:hypothetical protein CVT25_008287 [Psilocybe cyanescens]|uniref:Uncharacterized protein n=1 Tax=Psilocybe cyanescens TaxID=93625 RepID=A0A409XMU1_PSICY|nr:hypothetical protein CVT25_008287 [Psilocybe cyanescens]